VEEGPRFGAFPTTSADNIDVVDLEIAPESVSATPETWLTALSAKSGVPEQTVVAFLLAGGVAGLMGFFAAIRRFWSTARPADQE